MNRRKFVVEAIGWIGTVALGLVGCGKFKQKTATVTIPSEGLTAETPPHPVDSHRFTIPAAALMTPPAEGYTAEAVPPGHTITLSQQQLRSIASGESVQVRTDADMTGHNHDVTFKLA